MAAAVSESEQKGPSSQHQSAHGRSRSISVGQLPRSFQYGGDFLAQSAATAYKDNPAYTAIEKQTLDAVAPFLDLKKRESIVGKSLGKIEEAIADTDAGISAVKDTEKDAGKTAPKSSEENFSTPPKTRSYQHAHKGSSSSSVDLSSTPVSLHNRASSFSSTSYEDFRSNVRTIRSNVQQGLPESSNGLGQAAEQSKARRLSLSLGTSLAGVAPHNQMGFAPPAHRASLSHMGLPPQQLQALGHAYGMDSASPQQMEIFNRRLRSLSVGTPFSCSAPSSVPVAQTDSAFMLTRFIHDSIRQHTPLSHEIDEKLRLRADFESILQAIQPTASLAIFGSVKNGLNLANADLDLMVVDPAPLEDQLHDLHVDLPCLLAEALKAHGYAVKLLSKTRIPLIKVQRDYIGGAFCCDICFDNPLALHNTSLLATYASCDGRVPLLMMFVKLWARSRRINDSHSGTLNSYGFMLLLIYYLQNKVTPALLPNLQMISSTGRVIKSDELECQGWDVWFSKDVRILPAIQQNSNTLGELLEGFFSHFAYEFDYRDWVVSIRLPGGLQTKDSKGWTQVIEHLNESGSAKVKDRSLLTIEDPFEISHNVARTVTRAGLYDIRGEFMAAVRAVRSNKLADLTALNI